MTLHYQTCPTGACMICGTAFTYPCISSAIGAGANTSALPSLLRMDSASYKITRLCRNMMPATATADQNPNRATCPAGASNTSREIHTITAAITSAVYIGDAAILANVSFCRHESMNLLRVSPKSKVIATRLRVCVCARARI